MLYKFILYCISLPFLILILPFGIIAWIEKMLSKEDYLFSFGAHFVAIFPGFIGENVRRLYYIFTLDNYHPTAVMSLGSFFSKRNAKVHAHVVIGAYCVIGLVDIQESVRIASRVSITSGLHQHGNSSNISSGKESEGRFNRITIGSHSWLGEGSTISASIGKNCIIGVGSVVTNEISDNNMAMGNPARKLPTATSTPVVSINPIAD